MGAALPITYDIVGSAELLSRELDSAKEDARNLGHRSTNHQRPGQTLLDV